MKHFILWLLVSVTLLHGAPQQKFKLSTHEITIEGADAIGLTDLYDALGVEYAGKLQFWKDKKARIKDKLLPTLSASLRAFYDSEGFYDASFRIKKSKKRVIIHIKERQPVKVKDINISSDYDITSLVTFKRNTVFRAKEFIAVKSAIISKLLQEGYCSYDLKAKAYVDPTRHRVDLNYHLRKGGVCTFGEVSIKGTKTIDDAVIKSRVAAQKGDRFNTELVKDTSDGLYGLQAFDSVLIGVDRKFYNVVPVDIKLKEMEKPYHFEAGVGYDTYVGPRVHTSLTKHNFISDAQEAKIDLAWSALEQLAMASFYRPVFLELFDYYIGIGAEVGYSNLEFDGFKEKKTFLRGYLEYLSKQFKLRVGWASENILINALDNLSEGDELQFAVNEGTFLLTYPYADFIFDGRDSKLNPKKGIYLHLSGELGLSSDEQQSIYYKTFVEGRLIYSFGDLTLATVGILGIVDEERDDSLPESKYFFAGGSFYNRAYGFRELGVITSPTEDNINGARTWVNATFEADYPLVGDLYGAIFSDNTMLTPNSYQFDGEIITAAGVGIRYITPIGPFKLDVGFNVADPTIYGISFQIGQSF